MIGTTPGTSPISINAFFGEGYFSKAITGLGRCGAIGISLIGAAMAVELVRRGLRESLNYTPWAPKNDWWGARTAQWLHSKTGFASPVAYVHAHTQIDKYGKEVRDSRDQPIMVPEQHSTRTIAIQALAFIAFGIIANEAMIYLGGRPPAIWNKVATFIGPVRLNDEYYHVNVGNALRGTWLGNQFGIGS